MFFFYGSLRPGCYNFDRFALNEEEIATVIDKEVSISGYDLFSLGMYPAVKKSKDEDKKLIGSLVYIENPIVAKQIHYMEINAGYIEKKVLVYSESKQEYVEASLYLYEGNVKEENIVENGDWLTKVKV